MPFGIRFFVIQKSRVWYIFFVPKQNVCFAYVSFCPLFLKSGAFLHTFFSKKVCSCKRFLLRVTEVIRTTIFKG